METQDIPELLTYLREQLSKPNYEIAPLWQCIKEWHDETEQQVAIAYLQAHTSPPAHLPIHPRSDTFHGRKMLFNEDNQTLYTNDGTFIKQLTCPLQKKWTTLTRIEHDDKKRLCESCQKHVISTQGLYDQEVLGIMMFDPESCLHASPSFGNLALLPHKETRTDNDNSYSYTRPSKRDLRIIRTARTIHDMNQACQEGNSLAFVPVTAFESKISHFSAIYVNPVSGSVREHGPRSFIASNIAEGTSTTKRETYHFPSPYAAYIIPPDLTPGEHVQLDDLITNHIAYEHNGSFRLQSVDAIWNGTSFDIQYDESRDAPMLIG